MSDSLSAFHWRPQPDAGAWVHEMVERVLDRLPEARALARRLHDEAAVRFADLVDTIRLAPAGAPARAAAQAGWVQRGRSGAWQVLENRHGLFPAVALGEALPAGQVAIDLKVEAVDDFLAAHRLDRAVQGQVGAARRWALLWQADNVAVGVLERHGWRGMDAGPTHDPATLEQVLEAFRARRRELGSDAAGFAEAGRLIDDAIAAVGRDRACELFFAAEREHWQARNRAAQAQKARQDALGIGWANHDHHTYRSSRENFVPLVALWEKLGFACRERFYAGREAGWGAQVMEQAQAGIVTFNDVDLAPDELFNDFAHQPLPPQPSLGTVGLWCALHGDSVLEAGMHHLECQFYFAALARQLVEQAGVGMMNPFTDLPYLRQAFTHGERWPVRPERIDVLLAGGQITAEQAERFRRDGAIGSHLENLERHDGFKGFNQQGVSEIIAETDPRRQGQAGRAG